MLSSHGCRAATGKSHEWSQSTMLEKITHKGWKSRPQLLPLSCTPPAGLYGSGCCTALCLTCIQLCEG